MHELRRFHLKIDPCPTCKHQHTCHFVLFEIRKCGSRYVSSNNYMVTAKNFLAADKY